MAKRVFIALKTSTELKQKIFDWQQAQGDQPVRWIKPKNLHITIIPPWYCEDVEKTKKILEEVKGKFGSVTLRYSRITLGPTRREPRLIWMEGKTPQKMTDLKTFLEKLLRAKPEHRKLLLHVTIARFQPRDIETSGMKNLDETVNWEDNAEAILLMESHLTPEGAEYEVLAEIPL